MDLRGSGNIVGTDQSGFIKEVGVELYHQLLEEEISKQKNTILEKKEVDQKFIFQPSINLPEPIFIPDEYINDMGGTRGCNGCQGVIGNCNTCCTDLHIDLDTGGSWDPKDWNWDEGEITIKFYFTIG